jgi:predicted metal-binding protein
MELSRRFELPVYYGYDMNDAEQVLKRALEGRYKDDQIRNETTTSTECFEIIGHNSEAIFTVYPLAIENIVIDPEARANCNECMGVKKMMCPLEIGYENVHSLEESRKFINRFDHAFLVSTDLPDVDDPQLCKAVWLDLLGVEQKLARDYGEAFAFKLPLICPFCKPSECRLSQGYCSFESYYRPLHESYNINIASICKAFPNGIAPGIYALILVK